MRCWPPMRENGKLTEYLTTFVPIKMRPYVITNRRNTIKKLSRSPKITLFILLVAAFVWRQGGTTHSIG